MKPRSVRDRVAGKGSGLGLLDVAADVVEHHLLGGRHVDSRCPYLVGEPGPVVHIGDDLDHPGQCLVGCVDDDVEALAEDVEVGIGHQNRDFNEAVGLQVQAGHLTVDPHEFFTHSN